MKKFSAILLSLAMAASLAACGSAPSGTTPGSSGGSGGDVKPVTLKFSGSNNEEHPVTQHMYKIKEAVEKETDGRVLIDVFPANSLGDAEVVIQGVMDGSVDMMCMFISGTYDPRFNITSFPVILQNWDDAKKQNAEDSNYTKILTEACADNNMVYLGTHVDGFCGVSSVKEPQNYADPTKPKGCLIRCVTNEKSKQLLEAQGYQSIGLPWGDTYTSIQSGICDGSSGQSANGVYQNFRDVVKYYIPYNMTVDPMTYVINADSFAKLSEGDQQILRNAVMNEVMAAIEEGPALEEESFAKLEEAGVTILPLTDEEVANIHQHLWTALEPVMVDLTSREIVDAVVSDIQG